MYNSISYSVILKCGNDNEVNNPKRGNRGKKDSALIIYETIYYLNSFDSSNTHSLNHYLEINDKLIFNLNEFEYILIVDCDTDLEFNSLIILLDYLNNNDDHIAVCGQTIVKNKYENFITTVQYFEYFITHLLLKTFENVLYNVLVLSGCFTLLRLKDSNHNPTINLNILKEYTKNGVDIIEKNLVELGEDRYLTNLIIIEYPQYRLGYLPEAHCYTNVPNTNKILIDQRRRWTNSLIACSLFLLKCVKNQTFCKTIKMYILVLTELFIVFVLPIIIVMGFTSTVVSLTVQGFSYGPFIITIIIILLNLIIAIIMLKLDMILPFFAFLLYLPIFSIYIPIYSICNLDNLKWGLTRDAEAEAENNTNEVFEIVTPSNNIITF
jgi:cellulose synthase/poly-beta-1,6-N-acetylglucosamine synthase-like glycosyltransferase